MKTQLPKAELTTGEPNLNKEGLNALLTAHAGLKKNKIRPRDFTLNNSINFWWKEPLQEPLSGPDKERLKEDLTRQLCPVERRDLISYIKEDVREWALNAFRRRNGFYVSTHEFSEVYDFRYSVRARLQNTALLLEVSYV